MKVKIGPYISWIGPYQLAEKLMFWIDKYDDERVYKFGEWLNNITWLRKLCEWIHSKIQRTIKVKIDEYDTWSMDHTLAFIILPMLQQLQKTKHGSPYVDDEDVPEHLRRSAAPPVETEWDIDDNHHKRWDWVVGEMIWAFEQQVDDNAELQFFDNSHISKDAKLEERMWELNVDEEGYKKWQDRKRNGFRLFGKYYQCLWD